MFKFLGGARTGAQDAVGALAQSGQAGKDQRELVRVALKSLLAEQGIPLHWIGFEMDRAPASAGASSLAVRLVMQEWQESLLRYLPAISAAVVARLGQLDPSTDHQHDVVTWSFAADCGYPVTAFPAPSAWGSLPAIKAVQSARNTALLEEMFAQAPSSNPDFDAAQQTQPMNLDAIPSNFMASIPAHLDSEPLAVPPGQSGANKSARAPVGNRVNFDLPPSHLDRTNTAFEATEPSKLA